MKNLKIILTIVCLGGFCAFANAAGVVSKFMAGTAKIEVTPPEPKKEVHDPLYARSLILDVGGTRIAFISIDLAIYTNEPLLESLKRQFKLKELYFCSSHTHSGEKAETKWLDEQLTKVMSEASKNMFEAKISGGHRTFPQLAFNRLIVHDDGRARESWWQSPDGHYIAHNKERIPHGPVDPAVGVIRIENMKGEPKVVIMNYACHPDALFEVKTMISGDYVGYATKFTEEAFGNKVNCLFVQGGAGNQMGLFKFPTGREAASEYFKMVERMGKLLSIEAVKLTKELYPNPYDKPSIKLLSDRMDMPHRQDKRNVADVHFSTILINGRYAIATFPGEPLIKFQLDWKREMSPYAVPFFFGYTWNGGAWPSYVPDVRSAALGGYGGDLGPVREAGYGDILMIKHLLNYYKITGIYQENPK